MGQVFAQSPVEQLGAYRRHDQASADAHFFISRL